MKPSEFQTLFLCETSHWWYQALHSFVLQLLKKSPSGSLILDAGCGTGGMDTLLKAPSVVSLDYSETALSFCRKRALRLLVQSSICKLPFSNSVFDSILSLDVLQHRWVEDVLKSLEEMQRVLKKDGIIIIHVPAYRCLMSSHDANVETVRRFTKKDLLRLVYAAGFKPLDCGYRNALLFPLMAPIRLIRKIFPHHASSELSTCSSGWINKLLLSISLYENSLIERKVSFPFGLSIYCVARKL